MLDIPCLLVIVGATAVGKTALAIRLAQIFQSPILSADSRQVYRYFDIGTAKPTLEERSGVPHYLIDLVDPDYNFTLAEYQQRAQQLIADFHRQGVSPILVGGTGLYIRSVVSGLQIPHVAPQTDLRQQLSELGQNHCYQLLQEIDPLSSAKIHPHDAVRTLRALEVFYVTGAPPSSLQRIRHPQYPILQMGITSPNRSSYLQMIEQRIRQMLKRGWLEEIRFIQAGYGQNLPLLRTIGYAEMTDYLAGVTSLDRAIAKAVTSTYQFAKRQRTWFRSDQRIIWIDPHTAWQNLGDLLDLVHNRENWQVHTYDDATHHTA
jgi:tRNA dimethylallyltransferase